MKVKSRNHDNDILKPVRSAECCAAALVKNIPEKADVLLTKEELDLIARGSILRIYTEEREHYYIKLGTTEEMKTRHFIKLFDRYADDVLSGRKSFEIRYNDRDYREGDEIEFTVVDSSGLCKVPHDLNDVKFEITYVIEKVPGLQEGYAVLGIRRDDPAEDARNDTKENQNAENQV